VKGSPFVEAGVVPEQGSWLSSVEGWRDRIIAWYAEGPHAGEWRSNGDFFAAFEPARKRAGVTKSALVTQLRKLVAGGVLEKRIDYTRHPERRTPMMPFVEHRARFS
jgi:hypothetical protein